MMQARSPPERGGGALDLRALGAKDHDRGFAGVELEPKTIFEVRRRDAAHGHGFAR